MVASIQMKTIIGLVLLTMASLGFAQSLPVITLSPTNTTVNPGSTATFSVTATGATGYQWMFNTNIITGATSATLQIPNAQATNCGYYSVIVKNATGWTPSQMAYLFLDYTYSGIFPNAGGTLPLTTTNNTYFAGDVETVFGPPLWPTNGTAQIVAGPQLDEMSPQGTVVKYRSMAGTQWFNSGYILGPDQQSTFIGPGQTYFYSLLVKYTNSGSAFTQPSTVLSLTAGTNAIPAQPNYGLKFPGWFAGEGTEPVWASPFYLFAQLRISGETFSITNSFTGYPDYGTPVFQWRKNGVLIGTQQSFVVSSYPYPSANGTIVLTITNAQPSDAGVYDVEVLGNDWLIGPKTYISIQTTNGNGVFQQSKLSGTNLVCNLAGAAGRVYQVQVSTNLLTWSNLLTVSNATGTVTFTNATSNVGSQFYRTVLQSF